MKTTLATLAAAAVALSASPLAAESINVAYGDLNLASAAGQKTLDGRIDRAARQLCGHNAVGTRSVRENQAAKMCFQKAKAAANEQFAASVTASTLGG